MVRFSCYPQKRKKNQEIEGMLSCNVKRFKLSASNTDRERLQLDRKSLPIYQGRRRIINDILTSPCVIIMSETGSGKTTQVPQYLLEAGLSEGGMICCTQPRRVAAITIAQRVAEEKGSKLGNLVGYCVRFEDCTTERTKIKYMTDGMLLRESIGNPLLQKYNVILLDEAHERTVHTDVLFGIVKKAQQERSKNGLRPLKIVIMSATLQAEKFAQYFNDAKILYVEGRRHPIKMMFTENPQTDYLHAALCTSMTLHKEMPPGGDILVFLTGQEEIESLSRLIQDCAKNVQDEKLPKVSVHPLFAALPSSVQLQAVSPAKPGYRKIILATNIAETSLTIQGVKYVIDTGMVKVKDYNPLTGLDILVVRPVSKAQARQRSGRAGRECPGICYRLFTEDAFRDLQSQTVPEILRCSLPGVVLQLLALGIEDISKFDFMDPPSGDTLTDAVDQLLFLKAVELKDEKYKLTDIGKTMVSFPLDPRYSKSILAAKDFGCTDEVLSIVALLSVESITYTPSEKKDDVREVNAKFFSSEGDHVTYLNIYRAYKKSMDNLLWCSDHFVNPRAMKTVLKVRKQLTEICTRNNIRSQSCGKDFTKVRKALAAGLFMNSAELQRDGTFITTKHKELVAIHPSSALFRAKPAYVIFSELTKTSKCYMRGLSIVDPDWLFESCPEYFKRNKIHLLDTTN